MHCDESRASETHPVFKSGVGYGSMEVANNHTAENHSSGQGDRAGGNGSVGDIELVRTHEENLEMGQGDRRCVCVVGGPKCNECLAVGRGAVRVELESWSPRKTRVMGIILVAFVLWAVVFGVCLNVFRL